MLVGGLNDRLRYPADMGLADFGRSFGARLREARPDLADQLFGVTFGAVDLQPAETAHGELVHVQDDDLVARGLAEIARQICRFLRIVQSIYAKQNGSHSGNPPSHPGHFWSSASSHSRPWG